MSEKFLVAVDLDDMGLTKKMLRIAGEIANSRNAEVTLIHVGADLPPEVATHLPTDFLRRSSEELAEQLKVLAGELALSPEAMKVRVRHGSIYREILAQAEADHTELIFIGCHKPDATDVLFGSNAASVCRHAACSVYVVR